MLIPRLAWRFLRQRTLPVVLQALYVQLQVDVLWLEELETRQNWMLWFAISIDRRVTKLVLLVCTPRKGDNFRPSLGRKIL